MFLFQNNNRGYAAALQGWSVVAKKWSFSLPPHPSLFESGVNDCIRKKKNKTFLTFLNPSYHCAPFPPHSRLPSRSSPPLAPHLDLALIVLPAEPQWACTSDPPPRESCPNTCSFNVQFSFPCSKSQLISLLHPVPQPFLSSLAEERPNGNGDIQNVKLLCAYGCPQSNAGFLREDAEMCCDVICHRSCCTAPSETIKAQRHRVGVILKVLDC